MDFDWSVVVESLPALLDGAKLTVLIALTGLLGGTVVGLLFGLMRAYGNPMVSSLSFAYVELVRGTPIVVQVMFIYFALPMLLDFRVEPMTAAITSIVVNAGAYIAEIVRGAFLSVPKGLREAGLALGLPTWGVALMMVLAGSASYIAVPAAMRVALPEANPSIYLTLSLGVTFPFNLVIGIPAWVAVATAVGG